MDKTSHWTTHWESIAGKIAQRPKLLLASDFDGTLAPIAQTPAEAVLAVETRTLLRRLILCSGVHFAIISGRALADVQGHVGIRDLFYVGNHGLEISEPGITLQNPHGLKARGDLQNAVTFLTQATASREGVFIEDKGATASVHWRLASEETRKFVRDVLRLVVDYHPALCLEEGKCVWNLRPKKGWNKGDALRYLTARLGLTPEDTLYIGDDLTDENAFRAVQSGLTFHVGESDDESAAEYRFRDSADVRAFLLCLLGIRAGRPGMPVVVSTVMEPPLAERTDFDLHHTTVQ